jgi:hypothetical protein
VNDDQGDFQGCWNERRTEASTYLASWLANNPTGAETSNIMVLGDLNAYAKEDPVHELEQNGYVNLTQPTDHSYVFKGWSGSLDHALATGDLANKLVDVTEWHINADEPRVLDYNVEYKTQSQVQDYYSSEPYRSSDHDPIIAEFDFQAQTSSVELMNLQGLWGLPLLGRLYAIEVPQDATNLTINLNGGWGNADLYVRHSDKRKNQCRSKNRGNQEQCVITNPQSGTWYIVVKPRWFYAGVNLNANIIK